MKNPWNFIFFFLTLVSISLVPFEGWGTVVKMVQTSASTWEARYEGFVNVGGVLLRIKYDPATATAQGARKGGSVPAQSQYVVGAPPGEIRVAVAGLVPFPSQGVLTTVTLTPKDGMETRLLEISAELSSAEPVRRLPNAAIMVFPLQQTSTGGTSTGQTPTGQTPTGQTPTGQTPTGQTPTGQTPTGQTPTGQTPTGQTPTGQTPTGQTPTGQTPTGQTPTGQTPTGQTPTGQTPTGQTPTEGISGGVGGTWRSSSYVEQVRTQQLQELQAGRPAVTAPGGVTVTLSDTAGKEEKGGEPQGKGERIQAARQTVGVDQPSGPPEDSKKSVAEKREPPRSVRFGSILDRFRDFSGTPSREEFLALFADPVSNDIAQEPPIAWFAEDSLLTVKVKKSLLLTTEPAFVLKGASLVDLKSDNEFWILSARPRMKGGGEPRLVVMDGGERTVEYPLVIVPKIALPTVDGKGRDQFDALIRDRGAKTPRYDFDGDGSHTPADDYIFTANLIAQTGVKPVKRVDAGEKPMKDRAPSTPEKKGAEVKGAGPAGSVSSPSAERAKGGKKREAR